MPAPNGVASVAERLDDIEDGVGGPEGLRDRLVRLEATMVGVVSTLARIESAQVADSAWIRRLLAGTVGALVTLLAGVLGVRMAGFDVSALGGP